MNYVEQLPTPSAPGETLTVVLQNPQVEWMHIQTAEGVMLSVQIAPFAEFSQTRPAADSHPPGSISIRFEVPGPVVDGLTADSEADQ
ncbi:MAG: hypothetical protein RBT42_08165 [Aquabacterium sp.]|jgi:hypothetical protein|uniref:hypothetical protein n=1 Tax=Aquabacterium sp. TaxID=1872578 RepID=UPI002A361D13|nr:hypothetical protein [Aquabacterium sp.]MDX9843718.1 hypothetical protein [Aquabacterium sp.]